MFATSLTLADSTSVNKTFVKVSNDTDEAIFIDSATSMAAPRLATVKHTMAKPGVATAVDRHLVSFQHTVLDSAGKPVTATVNVTIAMPRSTITRTNADDLIAFAKNFLVTANVTSLLNGET